jgi:carboxyl-terminal processing protease
LTTQLPFKPFLKVVGLKNSRKQKRIASIYFNEVKEVNKKITALINKPKPPIPITIEAVLREQMKINHLSQEMYCQRPEQQFKDI